MAKAEPAKQQTSAKQFEINTIVVQERRRPQPRSPVSYSSVLPALQAADRLHTLKADIRRQIRQHWHTGSQLKNPVTVAFRLGTDGAVSDLHVTKPSGDANVDRAAVDAVKQSAPFKFPPEKVSAVQFTFDKRISSGLEDALDAVTIADTKISIPLN
jgi:TonB family protein